MSGSHASHEPNSEEAASPTPSVVVTCSGTAVVDDLDAFWRGYADFGIPAAIVGVFGLLALYALT